MHHSSFHLMIFYSQSFSLCLAICVLGPLPPTQVLCSGFYCSLIHNQCPHVSWSPPPLQPLPLQQTSLLPLPSIDRHHYHIIHLSIFLHSAFCRFIKLSLLLSLSLGTIFFFLFLFCYHLCPCPSLRLNPYYPLF